MATINLRNIDDNLARSMKVAAAVEGLTLKAWTEKVMWQQVGRSVVKAKPVADEPRYVKDEYSQE